MILTIFRAKDKMVCIVFLGFAGSGKIEIKCPTVIGGYYISSYTGCNLQGWKKKGRLTNELSQILGHCVVVLQSSWLRRASRERVPFVLKMQGSIRFRRVCAGVCGISSPASAATYTTTATAQSGERFLRR